MEKKHFQEEDVGKGDQAALIVMYGIAKSANEICAAWPRTSGSDALDPGLEAPRSARTRCAGLPRTSARMIIDKTLTVGHRECNRPKQHKLDPASMRVKEASSNEGPRLKRGSRSARGIAGRSFKRNRI